MAIGLGIVTTFSLQLKDFAEKSRAQADLIIRKTALTIHSRVVQKTPVDFGRARANWRVGINTPPSGVSALIDKSALGSNPNPASKAAAEGKIASFELGQTVYITNNLPYIGVLEYGRDNGTVGSIQAPNGMVRVTLAEFPNIVATVVNETKK